MKVAIRYYTRGGNTKKLADAIAEAIGVEAKTTSEPLTTNRLQSCLQRRIFRLPGKSLPAGVPSL